MISCDGDGGGGGEREWREAVDGSDLETTGNDGRKTEEKLLGQNLRMSFTYIQYSP